MIDRLFAHALAEERTSARFPPRRQCALDERAWLH
jgi:hypothetical protein